MQKDINVTERFNNLVERRGFTLSDFETKYRGKLKTTKWNTYEASQKKHLFAGVLRSIRG